MYQLTTADLEFGGEEAFSAPPERVYGLLTDLDTLAATIPDLVSSERVDERTLKCVVRPGFSFLRGTLKLTITVENSQPPESAAMRVAAQGIGVSLELASRLNIAAEGAGSRLVWNARVEKLTGLVAALSPTLIKAAADQVIRQAWQQVREKLGE
jgi:carbon monoxide dehydrogenase subunit G